MNIIDRQIEDYCLRYSKYPSTVLQELERQTHLTRLLPQMISGALQIALLQMLIQLHKPHKILEIGTFTGYSAIAMAQVMPEDGFLHTIEINEEQEPLILSFFRKARVFDKIKLHIGEAQKIIENMTENFDFVFLDADKENYPAYFEILIPKMNSGGVIVADNVLWDGKVIQPPKDKDRQTKGIQQFNKMVSQDNRVENVIIPIRDGLNVIRVI